MPLLLENDSPWALTDLPFPDQAPKLAYAATIQRRAREYASGSWMYLEGDSRRIDALGTLDLNEDLGNAQILLNFQQRIDKDRDFGLGFVATERQDLSNAALAVEYRNQAESGAFAEIWMGATTSSPDPRDGFATRLSFGIDRPETTVSLTLDRYTTDYYPATRPIGSQFQGTWGVSLDASHVLQFPSGPVNEVYLLFLPYLRRTDDGRRQGHGFDVLMSASSFEADSNFDLFYSQATYLTRGDSPDVWSEDYSEDRFLEATASFCNSCQWRPTVSFSDGVFTGSTYRQASVSLQYKATDSLTATLSATWAEEEGAQSERQEVLLRWKPSDRLSATFRGRIEDGEFERARIKVDAELSPSVSTSVTTWVDDEGLVLDADMTWDLDNGAAIQGALTYDSQGETEIGGRVTWRF